MTMGDDDPRGVANLDPRGMIGRFYVEYTPILLYRGDSCIGDFTYYVNFHSQRHLAIVYIQNISRQISNLQLQQKICKMLSIVTIKFIHLQMACRKQYSA